MDIKAIKLSQLLHFLFYCPHNGCLRPLTIGVHLWEVKNEKRRENAGTTDWCPLMGDVRFWEVFVSGGLTEATTPDRSPWDT